MTAEIKNQDIMIDIETMGQGSNAAVVAIGAVFFTEDGLGHEFYEKIDLREASKYGDIDPDTILWWFKQSDEGVWVKGVHYYDKGDLNFRLFDMEAIEEWVKSENKEDSEMIALADRMVG